MKLTLRQIEAFQAVMEHGNFSRAAERMNTSQPALSQAIRDLEVAVGARLFDRTTRRVELTEAGRAFEASALTGLSEIERAVENVRDMSNLQRGLVRIAAPPLLASCVLPQVVHACAIAFPNLEVRIDDVDGDEILDLVRRGRAEIGLGTFSQNEDGLDYTPILRDSLVVFMPVEHPLAQRAELSWADLGGHAIATLTRESSIRLLIDVGFETANTAFRPAFEVNQINTVLALVEVTGAIAILPAYCKAALSGRRINVTALRDPLLEREIDLVRSRDRILSPAVQAVRGLLRKTLRDLRPVIE